MKQLLQSIFFYVITTPSLKLMMYPDSEKHLSRAYKAGQGANKTRQKTSPFSQAKRLRWTTTHSREHGSCGLSLL